MAGVPRLPSVYSSFEDEPHHGPVVDRATFLPVGAYADNSVAFPVWPAALKHAYEGAVRSYYASAHVPVSDESGYIGTVPDRPLDPVNAASVGPISGVGARLAGAIPRGALGSGGSDMLARVASDLPMDEAARLARAREMGFDTDSVWYHGTRAPDFHAFDPELTPKSEGDTAAFFSDRPSVASGYAGVQRHMDQEYLSTIAAPYLDRSRIYPVYARSSNLKVLDRKEPQWRYQNKRDMDRARDEGYSGVEYRYGSGGREIAMFDPRNIRSVNAAFDPAQSGSANLLAANDPTSSLPFLLGQQPQEEPTYDWSLPPIRTYE